MTWKYHIIKDKDGYWLAEVFSDKKKNHSWCKILDTCCDTPEELQDELKMRFIDSIKNEVLLVKKNKLYGQTRKGNDKIGKGNKR
jgi:hypothetical protein